MKRFAPVFFLLLLSTAMQAGNYRFNRLTTLEGLSSDQVNTVYTDRNGFTWIGTSTGLDRYDGKQVIVYTHHRSDSSSIPHDNVRTICEDRDGMLWIGTDNGIARFNPWNGKATLIRRKNPPGTGYPACYGCYITSSGEIWAWALNETWIYNPATRLLELVTFREASGKAAGFYNNLYEDREKRFWICSGNGLYLADRSSGKATLYPLSADRRTGTVNSIFEDSRNQLWCATWGSGICRFHPNNGQFESWPWIHQSENPSAVNIVYSIAETSGPGGKLWAGTNYGLATWDGDENPEGDNVQFIKHDPSAEGTIQSTQVGMVYVNASGQVWAATHSGISVLLPGFQLFQRYAPGFAGRTIRIVPDGTGGDFFCTWYGNGLQQIDSSGKLVRSWKRIPANGPVDNGQVSDVCRDGSGNLWVATFGGLAAGDANGEHFTLLEPDEKDPQSICDKHTTCVGWDPAGYIWAGGYRKGLSRIDPKNHKCRNYTAEKDGLGANLVWSVFVSKNGTVWIGTNYGVSKYNPIQDRFETIRYCLAGKDTIWLGLSAVFFEDASQTLWIGTENGLFRRGTDGSLTAYTKEDGLPSNEISGIREDREKNIWISTSNGLSEFHPADKTFTNFSAENGLPVSSLTGDMSRTGDGRILLGLADEIYVFDPQKLDAPSVPPALFLTGVSIADRPVAFDVNPGAATASRLNWNENMISFDFVAPGMRSGPDIRYSYRLLGSDESWILSGERHFASFAGLPPGDYTFQCRASVANGKWSEPVSYSFTITPPFWKTWWFISAGSLIILLTVVFIVRRESTRKIRERLLVLEKEQAVQKERNRISRDMHDDLGSGLTKIAILSEVLKKKINQPAEAQKQIDTISDSARNLVDNLNEIIWALNPENDNFRNLAAYTREYADKYLETFGIRLDCELPDSLSAIQLSEEKRRFLFLVVKESLHNIVKHAGASVVQLQFASNGKSLQIAIGDNGKGFEISESRPLGNGLKNMRRRMESIGGTYEIESSPGKGTVTRISVSAGNAA
jgi:signal transduction histidine kinase/ligand-binding sensor domain-containing protein